MGKDRPRQIAPKIAGKSRTGQSVTLFAQPLKRRRCHSRRAVWPAAAGTLGPESRVTPVLRLMGELTDKRRVAPVSGSKTRCDSPQADKPSDPPPPAPRKKSLIRQLSSLGPSSAGSDNPPPQGEDWQGNITLDGVELEVKIARGFTYVVTWCRKGDNLAEFEAMPLTVNQLTRASDASTSASPRRREGPQHGGTCDLYTFPTTTFSGADGVALTVALKGNALKYLKRLMLAVLGDVSTSP